MNLQGVESESGRTLGNVRTDSMGRSTVLYWPGIDGDAMEPDEDDEEE